VSIEAEREERLRAAKAQLGSFVHRQTPTKTLSGEAAMDLIRLMDEVVAAARETMRPISACDCCDGGDHKRPR